MTFAWGCSETVALKKLCTPKKFSKKTVPWIIVIGKNQIAAIEKVIDVPFNKFICRKCCKSFWTAKKIKIIKPGKKNPMGPFVKTAIPADMYEM